LVKFVIDANEYELKLAPSIPKSKKWNLDVYMDSDWAGHKNNRHIVLGYSIFKWCRGTLEIQVPKPIGVV
jgi:hypothetical protein